MIETFLVRFGLVGKSIHVCETDVIKDACNKLGQKVSEHLAVYGDRYEEQRVWHDCGDLSKTTHWVEPHFSGTRYSLVAFFGNPPRTKRRSSTAPETCVDTDHDKT